MEWDKENGKGRGKGMRETEREAERGKLKGRRKGVTEMRGNEERGIEWEGEWSERDGMGGGM